MVTPITRGDRDLPGNRGARVCHIDLFGIGEIHLRSRPRISHNRDRGRLRRQAFDDVSVLNTTDDGRLNAHRLVAELLAHRDANSHRRRGESEAAALRADGLALSIDGGCGVPTLDISRHAVKLQIDARIVDQSDYRGGPRDAYRRGI